MQQLFAGVITKVECSYKKAKREPICFTNDDLPRGPTSHNDALVITMDIKGMVVCQVFVDTCNSVNILYNDLFFKLDMKNDQLRIIKTPR